MLAIVMSVAACTSSPPSSEGPSPRAASACPESEDIGFASETLAISSAEMFHGLFPHAGETSELEQMRGELTVVVYRGGYPGVAWGDPGDAPSGTSAARVREPGTVDVCIEAANGAFVVYSNIPTQ